MATVEYTDVDLTLSCATCNFKFKTLVETDKVKINSKMLISEMKSFIASGNSYSAKIGDTDDLVMATLLVMRMALTIKSYNRELDSLSW